MLLHEYNKSLLAICLYREARSEGLMGMRGVGWVIRNRVREWGKTWYKVICADGQFTSMNPPGKRVDDPTLDDWLDPHSQWGMDILELAKEIYEGEGSDPTYGSLYYANLTNMDKGGWFQRNIVAKPDEHPIRVTLGRHTFFA